MTGRIVSFTASKYQAYQGEPITLTIVVENTTIVAQNYRLIGKAQGSCVNQQGAMDISVAREGRREITININMHGCTHVQTVELWQSGYMLDSKSLTLTLLSSSGGAGSGSGGSGSGGTGSGTGSGGGTGSGSGSGIDSGGGSITYRVSNVSVSGHYLFLRAGECYSFGPYDYRSRVEKDTYIFEDHDTATVTFTVDGPTPYSWYAVVGGRVAQGFDETRRTVSFSVGSYNTSSNVTIQVWRSGVPTSKVEYVSNFVVLWSRWPYRKIECEAEIRIAHYDEWGRDVGGIAEIYQGSSLVGRNYAKVRAYSDVRIKILDNPGYVYVKTFMTIADVTSKTFTSKEFTTNVGFGIYGAVTWKPEQPPPQEYRAYDLVVKSGVGGSVIITAGPDVFTVNENETKTVTVIGFVTIKAVPKTGYRFEKFNVDGQVVYSETYAWTLTKNTTVNAYFVQSGGSGGSSDGGSSGGAGGGTGGGSGSTGGGSGGGVEYVRVNWYSSPSSGGYVEVKKGNVSVGFGASGSTVVEKGSVITFSATPTQGFRFVRWSTGSTNSTISITASSDITVTAYFEGSQPPPSENGTRIGGMIESLTATPNPARAGERVTLTAVIKNTGNVRTTYRLVGKAYGSCVNETGEDTITIDAGQTKSYSVSFNMHPCPHRQEVELYYNQQFLHNKFVDMLVLGQGGQDQPPSQPPSQPSDDILRRLIEILSMNVLGLPLWIWLVIIFVVLVIIR